MNGARLLVVNDYEAEMICTKTGMSIHELRGQVETLIITQGERGSHIYAETGMIDIPIFPPDAIIDPTGVGDAYRAGLIFGMTHGFEWALCGRLGALCATYVLEQNGPQSHHFTPAAFARRFRTHFDDGGRLDFMLD
jgi:adenosine kinase